MTDTTASLDDVTLYGGREFAFCDIRALLRGTFSGAAMGFGAIAAVGAAIGVSTVAGVWMVGVGLAGNSHLRPQTQSGPARLALADAAAFPQSSFEAKWARTKAVLSVVAREAARRSDIQDADTGSEFGVPAAGVLRVPQVKHQVAHAPATPQIAALTPPARTVRSPPAVAPKAPKPVAVARIAPVPLPRPKPAQIKFARAASGKAASHVAHVVAALTPPIAKEGASRHETNKAPVLPGPDSRTALYDIAGHTVYMPDGARLEAHSGLGNDIDNPRFIKVRMRGPTPPNVYDLTLRENLFHGVRTIRLNPVDESKMFGRAGMLAHPYMLGPNGQSNGCVSFKDYDKFLRAFLHGKVDRMVVVRNLDEAPAHLARLLRTDRGGGGYRRYAANDVNPIDW